MDSIRKKKNILATKNYKYFYDNFDQIENNDNVKFIDKLNYDFLQKKYDLENTPLHIDSYKTVYMKYFLEKIFLFENYEIELFDIKKLSDHILKMYNASYTIFVYNYNYYPNGYRPKYKIKIINNFTNEETNFTHSVHISKRMFYDSIYEKLIDMIICANSDMF